jgi:Protein of unknown function (DUF2752)
VKISRIRSGGALALGFIYLPFALFARTQDGFTHGGGIPCIWRSITGYPCPGCGLTRSLASMSHLDIVSAVRFNPSGLLIVLVALVAVLRPQTLISARDSYMRKVASKSDRSVMIASASLFLVITILNIIRVQSGFYPALTN